MRRCSRRPELQGRGFNNYRRQRRLRVAVIRKLPTSALGRPRVVDRQRRLLLRVCSEVAIPSEVRIEDVFRSGIRESFGAVDGEMRDVIYTIQHSNNNENDRALFPTKVLAHAAEVASSGKDDILARETANGLSL